jgi:hypothetical protein
MNKKLEQSKEKLRKLLLENPDLKEAFMETLDELSKTENIEKLAKEIRQGVEVMKIAQKDLQENKVTLIADFNYFMENLDEFIKNYKDKYVVIKDKKLLGNYLTFDEAVKETLKTEKYGTFLVQMCYSDKEDYVQKYHSRVSFDDLGDD